MFQVFVPTEAKFQFWGRGAVGLPDLNLVAVGGAARVIVEALARGAGGGQRVHARAYACLRIEGIHRDDAGRAVPAVEAAGGGLVVPVVPRLAGGVLDGKRGVRVLVEPGRICRRRAAAVHVQGHPAHEDAVKAIVVAAVGAVVLEYAGRQVVVVGSGEGGVDDVAEEPRSAEVRAGVVAQVDAGRPCRAGAVVVGDIARRVHQVALLPALQRLRLAAEAGARRPDNRKVIAGYRRRAVDAGVLRARGRAVFVGPPHATAKGAVDLGDSLAAVATVVDPVE